MSRFIQWLVRSSANPENVSMTVKGALIGIIPVILFFAQQLHLSWTSDQLTELIQSITVFLSSFLIIVGMARKIIISVVNLGVKQ